MVKAVALQVRDVARKIVRREKTGFVQRRFIETVISAWEAMEWARDTGQQALFLKIDFYKAYYRIDRTFITDMLTCLGFGPRCVGMVITLFSYASALISVINTLYPRIHLHKSIAAGKSDSLQKTSISNRKKGGRRGIGRITRKNAVGTKKGQRWNLWISSIFNMLTIEHSLWENPDLE